MTHSDAASRTLLISCVGVESDLPLLPHFLRHYLDLGVAPERMHIVLNALTADAPGLAEARAILAEHGVDGGEDWIEPYTSDAMWDKRREVQRRVASPEDWVVSADVDEFCEFPAPLGEVLDYCERRGANCVQGVFIDRLAPGGALAEIEPAPSLWDQFPVEADVICTIRQHEGDGDNYKFGTVNVMLCRGDVLPSRGGHAPLKGEDAVPVSFLLGTSLGRMPGITNSAVRFAIPFRVHHFKWTEALAERHQRRLDTPGASSAGSAYGRLLLDRLALWGGRIGLGDVPVRHPTLADRVPWRVRTNALRATVAADRGVAFARRAAGAVKRRVA
ncbi:hypothetical protein RQM47_08390 [Rubrivirga sp. S365]|uniref:hypothetical protein n=1 Tax=Rubrivirga sp. S365 TaxID=3076080 RepID=UPI0028C65C72|nr:hypothetical protein [Rubrivirga sp. S365]MDT7856656.1 hypothetical protein [Rubrivirga sp. S365]